MAKLRCSSVLLEAPQTGSLLLYLEREVLKRHCCQRQTLATIASTLGLKSPEVRRLHDRAALRLDTAINRLLDDLVADGLAATPAGILRELQASHPAYY